MRWGLRGACLGAFLALMSLAALVAKAKTDSSVTVEGRGLGSAVTFAPDEAAQLMVYSGFWRESCSADSCRGRASYARPDVNALGPRYRLTWDLVWYRRNSTTLHQDVVQYVYPFAEPRPLTYMPPNQLYLRDARTGGGWFVASLDFLQEWRNLGLPATTIGSTATPSGGETWSDEVTTFPDGRDVALIVAALALSAAILVLAGRQVRRSRMGAS